jgi:8-oxo-dGTP pyrophosphatase MutT (NUDIX family)
MLFFISILLEPQRLLLFYTIQARKSSIPGRFDRMVLAMSAASDPFAVLRRKLRARRPRRIAAPARARTSVAVVLCGSRRGNLEVLLMERSQHPRDPWSGHVALPGGRWGPCDRDRLATSIREAREETGVALRRRDLLGGLDDLSPRTPTYPELAVRPFVFGLLAKPALAPGPEAAECFWVRLDRLPAAACEADFVIAGKPRRLPGFRVGSRIVWGITHRILASLLEIGKD